MLNGDVDNAICLHAFYYAIWKRFGALPERYNWQLQAPDVLFYPLRPELVESTYLLYQVQHLSVCSPSYTLFILQEYQPFIAPPSSRLREAEWGVQVGMPLGGLCWYAQKNDNFDPSFSCCWNWPKGVRRNRVWPSEYVWHVNKKNTLKADKHILFCSKEKTRMSTTNEYKSDSESWDLLTPSPNNITLQCPIWTGVAKWHYFASVQTSWGKEWFLCDY